MPFSSGLIHRGLEHHLALIDENDLVQNLFHIGDQVGGDNLRRLGIVVPMMVERCSPGWRGPRRRWLIQQIQLAARLITMMSCTFSRVPGSLDICLIRWVRRMFRW